jgi:type I restriction enzyme S subunit
VEWKTLGENISKTSNIKWSHTDGNFRYIDLSSVDRDKKFITETTEINAGNAPSRAQKIVLEDDVIFATTRPTQMRVCLITEKFSNQIASTGFCVLRAMKNTVLPKWILYQLTSNSFKNYLEENQAGIAYPAISDAKIKDFKIPIPFPNDQKKSIQEQERIVRLLDQFDEATKNIIAQLEKEIELRNKEYNYYRDHLLTFPKE